MANIRVARVYMMVVFLQSCPEKFGIVWGTEGDQRVKSLEEENKETDWRCRVGTAL